MTRPTDANERLVAGMLVMDVAAVAQALADGADPQTPVPNYKSPQGREFVPLEVTVQRLRSHAPTVSCEQRVAMAELLLSYGASTAPWKVHLASYVLGEFDAPLLDCFLRHGESLEYTPGHSLLHALAATDGSLDLTAQRITEQAQVLLDHGVPLEGLNAQGRTPLMVALRRLAPTPILGLLALEPAPNLGWSSEAGAWVIQSLNSSNLMGIGGPEFQACVRAVMPALQRQWEAHPEARVGLTDAVDAMRLELQREREGGRLAPKPGYAAHSEAWSQALGALDACVQAWRMRLTVADLEQRADDVRTRPRM